MLPVLWSLKLQIQVPAAAGILGKAAAADFPLDGPAEPEPVPPPEEDHRIALQWNGPPGLKRDPAQGFFAAPSRTLAAAIPGDRELLAHRLYGIRAQAEELAAAAAEMDQIKARGPALVVPSSGVVDLPAIVPDPVHRPSLPLKMPTGARILDPVPVSEHHRRQGSLKRAKSTIQTRNFPVHLHAQSAVGDLRSDSRVLSDVHAVRNVSRRPSITRAARPASAAARSTQSAPPPRPERQGFRRGELR